MVHIKESAIEAAQILFATLVQASLRAWLRDPRGPDGVVDGWRAFEAAAEPVLRCSMQYARFLALWMLQLFASRDRNAHMRAHWTFAMLHCLQARGVARGFRFLRARDGDARFEEGRLWIEAALRPEEYADTESATPDVSVRPFEAMLRVIDRGLWTDSWLAAEVWNVQRADAGLPALDSLRWLLRAQTSWMARCPARDLAPRLDVLAACLRHWDARDDEDLTDEVLTWAHTALARAREPGPEPAPRFFLRAALLHEPADPEVLLLEIAVTLDGAHHGCVCLPLTRASFLDLCDGRWRHEKLLMPPSAASVALEDHFRAPAASVLQTQVVYQSITVM